MNNYPDLVKDAMALHGVSYWSDLPETLKTVLKSYANNAELIGIEPSKSGLAILYSLYENGFITEEKN